MRICCAELRGAGTIWKAIALGLWEVVAQLVIVAIAYGELESEGCAYGEVDIDKLRQEPIRSSIIVAWAGNIPLEQG